MAKKSPRAAFIVPFFGGTKKQVKNIEPEIPPAPQMTEEELLAQRAKAPKTTRSVFNRRSRANAGLLSETNLLGG